jgi:quercetin dioxygenase-like cupin family protein
VQLLAVVAAVIAWLGWFEIAPALGFPTIGPAAMLNRLFVPQSDPGAWVGWVVLVLGLVAVASLYSLGTARVWFRPGVVSGLLFGFAAWVVLGAVAMVIIGRISPPPPAPPPPPGPPLPSVPDPMHATFMMLHLGALAPAAALVAWLLLGSVVGAAAATVQQPMTRPDRRRVRPGLSAPSGLMAVAALSVTGWSLVSSGGGATAKTATDVQTQILAEGPAEALPEGPTFVSVIELRQAPGATLGPHAHVPGFAYVLEGREAITFQDRSTISLGSEEGGFMGALEVHSHENRQDRTLAGSLALGLIVLGVTMSVASLARIASSRAVIAGMGGLIVAGAVALWNPWSNDWYFIAVRPEASRGGVMPLPDSSRTYESPVLEGLAPGPYTEQLRLITVSSGEVFTVESAPGPEMFLVLNGQAEARFDDDSPVSLDASGAALAQPGASVELSNPTAGTLEVLSFRVIASEPGP